MLLSDHTLEASRHHSRPTLGIATLSDTDIYDSLGKSASHTELSESYPSRDTLAVLNNPSRYPFLASEAPGVDLSQVLMHDCGILETQPDAGRGIEIGGTGGGDAIGKRKDNNMEQLEGLVMRCRGLIKNNHNGIIENQP